MDDQAPQQVTSLKADYAKLVAKAMTNISKTSVLDEKGSNFKDWKFLMERWFAVLKLEPAFEFKVINAAGEEKTMSSLTLEGQSKMLKMTDENAKAAVDRVIGDDEKKLDIRTVCHTGICTAIGLKHLWIVKDSHHDPAVIWPKIVNEFSPAGSITARELHAVLNRANLERYDNDFSRMAAAIKGAATQLKKLGAPQSEERLITSLTQGMTSRGWSVIRTIIEDDTESSFNEIVAKVNGMLRSKKQRKAEKRSSLLNIEAHSGSSSTKRRKKNHQRTVVVDDKNMTMEQLINLVL